MHGQVFIPDRLGEALFQHLAHHATPMLGRGLGVAVVALLGIDREITDLDQDLIRVAATVRPQRAARRPAISAGVKGSAAAMASLSPSSTAPSTA